jgi:Lactoylglutathione lyase and related lyases
MAVMPDAAGLHVARLRHIRLCSADAKPLARFYESALGFRQLAVEHLSGARAQELLGVGGCVLRITLELGNQRMAIVQFVDRPGPAYPEDATASDLIFQHFAIVVADMAAAMAQLEQVPGWSTITTGGPQQLPASSGGVTAFKFRDPEGHPLELLAFPAGGVPEPWRRPGNPGPFLGIDHSAISVSDRARSVAFYASLGFQLKNQSVNDDPGQSRLDHLQQPMVVVTAMNVGQAPPHLELLCYRGSGNASPLRLKANDVAASCLVFERDPRLAQQQAGLAPVQNLLDPDGHHLSIENPEL